jgi:beta-lactam-binding protein with PASTA domain
VRGDRLEQAQATLAAAGFSDIQVQREGTDNASEVGRVLDQSPSPGRSASTDEQVTLLVGQQSGDSSSPSETSGNGGGN